MSIYYKYEPDGKKMFVISYVDDCVYWYTYEDPGKCFVGNLGKIFHVKFLVYAHWFILIRLSYMKDHSISVYQSSYVTYIVDKYMDTATVNTGKKFHKTIFPSDVIFTKDDVSISYGQVKKLTR